jgi:hypothetical protein
LETLLLCCALTFSLLLGVQIEDDLVHNVCVDAARVEFQGVINGKADAERLMSRDHNGARWIDSGAIGAEAGSDRFSLLCAGRKQFPGGINDMYFRERDVVMSCRNASDVIRPCKQKGPRRLGVDQSEIKAQLEQQV